MSNLKNLLEIWKKQVDWKLQMLIIYPPGSTSLYHVCFYINWEDYFYFIGWQWNVIFSWGLSPASIPIFYVFGPYRNCPGINSKILSYSQKFMLFNACFRSCCSCLLCAERWVFLTALSRTSLVSAVLFTAKPSHAWLLHRLTRKYISYELCYISIQNLQR